MSAMNTNFLYLKLVNTNLAIYEISTSITSSSNAVTDFAKVWGPIIVGFTASFLAFIAQLILISRQRFQAEKQNELTRRQLQLVKSKEEREEILRKLNTFYGPFKELRSQSQILYRKFADSHRRAAKANGKRFRTLPYILEGNSFTGQDAELLTQILQLDKELLRLIESHSGVVDKPGLQELLGKLGAHIRILQLACEGKLSGPPDLFTDIVFPSPIDGAIESATLRLQDKLRELGIFEDSSSKIPANSDRETDSTIAYYDKNAEVYAQNTLFIDVKHLYREFIEYLPLGARILDAGCGAGRDTRYFIESGNIVISFDASHGMVQKCREYPHAYCITRTFNEIDFKEEFDGVWACASLLHMDSLKAAIALYKLTTSLKPGGVLFISLKDGQRAEYKGGRLFQHYSIDGIRELYASDARLELVKYWSTSSDGCDESGKINWHNVLLRRRAQT